MNSTPTFARTHESPGRVSEDGETETPPIPVAAAAEAAAVRDAMRVHTMYPALLRAYFACRSAGADRATELALRRRRDALLEDARVRREENAQNAYGFFDAHTHGQGGEEMDDFIARCTAELRAYSVELNAIARESEDACAEFERRVATITASAAKIKIDDERARERGGGGGTPADAARGVDDDTVYDDEDEFGDDDDDDDDDESTDASAWVRKQRKRAAAAAAAAAAARARRPGREPDVAAVRERVVAVVDLDLVLGAAEGHSVQKKFTGQLKGTHAIKC